MNESTNIKRTMKNFYSSSDAMSTRKTSPSPWPLEVTPKRAFAA
jgi:hypothetical protein